MTRMKISALACLLALASLAAAQTQGTQSPTTSGGGANQSASSSTGGTATGTCPATGMSIDSQPALPEITRGQPVTIKGCNFPDGVVNVRLNTGKPKADDIPLPAKRVDDKTITFQLPADKVPTDRYLVSLEIAGQKVQVPGDLRVIADTSAAVHLDAAYPITVYPTDHPGFDFEISGQNLGADDQSNTVIVVGRGPISIGGCDAARKEGRMCIARLHVEPGMETRKLQVIGFEKAEYDGPISVQVLVGRNVSNSVPLTFSRIPRGVVGWSAFILFAAIMFAVFLLVRKGVTGKQKESGFKLPFKSFFLDKTTNTYSLSKFQLLLWTSAFVYGYLYLFLCRLLIQSKFELPPIPDGMPGMLAISAGTAVAAVGATEARGSKGAGDIHPSVADFITSGGLVVGERFQFFVWTLVGAFGFLSILLLSDPSTVNELPSLPQNFLYLMGISSAGYLAGKVVRKPGPVIRKLYVSQVTEPTADKPATMTIQLQGENMQDTAILKVGPPDEDGKELKKGDYTISKPGNQPPSGALCTDLNVMLCDATNYLAGSYKLTLTNEDGQAASAGFPVDPLKLESATTDGKVVTLTGKNFGDAMKARVRKKGAQADLPDVGVQRVSDSAATITDPGDFADATLYLVSGVKLRSESVTVGKGRAAGG